MNTTLNERIVIEAIKTLGINESNLDLIQAFWISTIGKPATPDFYGLWCSAWMNYVAQSCGAQRTHKSNALSWLDVGIHIPLTDPYFIRLGDIMIFSRSNNPKEGHVGVYLGKTNQTGYKIISGNYKNAVSISDYPVSKLLGIRRLRPI